jgi:hypothetical protein
MAVSFTETSNPASCFMLRFLPDAMVCLKQTTFYHQLEAQHLHERRFRGWGASRIPHLTPRQFLPGPQSVLTGAVAAWQTEAGPGQ